jgi:hypothetical protein
LRHQDSWFRDGLHRLDHGPTFLMWWRSPHKVREGESDPQKACNGNQVWYDGVIIYEPDPPHW